MEFIQRHPEGINRRDIAKSFGIKGGMRVGLKALLKELPLEAGVNRRGKRYGTGDMPVKKSRTTPSKTSSPRPLNSSSRSFNPIASADTFIGVFHRDSTEVYITSVSKKDRMTYIPVAPLPDNVQQDDLIEVEFFQRPIRSDLQEVKILRVIGSLNDPKSLGLIAVHEHDLPYQFSDAALALAAQAPLPMLEGREDLRAYSLVTIDDEDARDFDDAVWAEEDPDPLNYKGWHLLVAIADVSFYVKPGEALDVEALERGNSVYFPDRVIPMLPEDLSNNLCSLRPQEERACLAVHLWITQTGKIRRHQFVRGLMKSSERLSYREVQEAMDGKDTRLSDTFIQKTLHPLYGAFEALKRGKEKRGPLNLDLPEERIYLDDAGKITKITPRARFDSHRLIEEFMILANVAAAMTLNDAHALCMYRVHDQPTTEKIHALQEFLKTFEISLPKGQVIVPKIFNHILEKAAGKAYESAVNHLVLRSQAQAVYSAENIGHFGLNLPRYAHFTSPIRRYADLLVHRALIPLLGPAQAESFVYTPAQFTQMAQHISMTERRAALAERDTMARYVTAYLSVNKGEIFSSHISGVTEGALFIRIEDNGADGMIPVRALGNDYYIHDRVRHQLVGKRTRHLYSLGQRIKVMLQEADPIKGSLIFVPAPSMKTAKKYTRDEIRKKYPKKKNNFSLVK